MTTARLLSIILVFPGTLFLATAIFMGLATRKKVPELLRRKWFVIICLMLFFLFGYLVFLAVQIRGLPFPLEVVTSTIFLGGALFVLLVIRLTQITIEQVRSGELRVSKTNEQLMLQNRILANEIQARTLAEGQAKSRLQYLSTLHAIDMIITSSLDLKVTFRVFLEQVVPQLRADAGVILLLNNYTQTLEYKAGIGFAGPSPETARERLGQGSAGTAALERRLVHISRLPGEEEPRFVREAMIAGERFVSYVAVPLIARGQVKGVFELFRRSPFEEDREWRNFLDALAGQAAIAIDNATLFNDLQLSNAELVLAYDTTIEGWARALELRDEETEGHTQRVTAMTVQLAETLGMSNEALVHVRRGALLHDIGKMAVPDAILLKRGPLTDEEQEIMRRHPVHAFEMLSPIVYLRPALDIPYCHHEKWDGSGYPRRLKGEQIPLAARIFALADNWDALTSERRYHAAWPSEKVAQHLRAFAGTHFDPELVERFLAMLLPGSEATEARLASDETTLSMS